MSMDLTGSTRDGDVSAATVYVQASARPRARRARGLADGVYRWITLVVSLGIVVILAAIVIVLFSTAWPALGRLGVGFFTGATWNASANIYGALPFIVGTLITTVLALVIAVPLSLAIAILLSEYAPRVLATALGVVIDVAAGVPTIVFGAWALLALIPWLSHTGEPAVAAVLGWLPPFNPNSTPNGTSGYDLFAAGLVLAAMIFPTIVAVSRNALLATPNDMREASLGLGATRWETALHIALRHARSGVLGAVILACGRALGETLAVAYVIGTVPYLPRSLFDQGATLATELFTQVQGTIPGTLATGALYELGVILLALSLLTSFTGQLLTRRLGGAALVGAGR